MDTALVVGVVLSSTYSLIAILIVFVYEATGVLNLAMGGLGAIGAFTYSELAAKTSALVGLVVVLACAVVGGGIIGIATVPIRTLGSEIKATVSLGVLLACLGFLGIFWNVETPHVVPLINGTAFFAAGVPITWQRVLMVGVVIAASLALVGFLRYTRNGSAVRAIAVDENVARIIGLPITRLWIVAWILSTAASIGAMIVALPDLQPSIDGLTFIVLTPLAAALVARFKSIVTAIIICIVIGMGSSLMNASNSLQNYADVLPLVVVAAAMLLRWAREARSRTFSSVGQAANRTS
jgi:branched-chain amino acid transport system permease protein